MRHIGGPREASFPETIPEETSSTEEEHVVGVHVTLWRHQLGGVDLFVILLCCFQVIFRLGSYTDSDGLRESQVYKVSRRVRVCVCVGAFKDIKRGASFCP